MIEKVRGKIHQYFVSKTDFLTVKDKLNEDQLRAFVIKAINEFCVKEEITLTKKKKRYSCASLSVPLSASVL